MQFLLHQLLKSSISPSLPHQLLKNINFHKFFIPTFKIIQISKIKEFFFNDFFNINANFATSTSVLSQFLLHQLLKPQNSSKFTTSTCKNMRFHKFYSNSLRKSQNLEFLWLFSLDRHIHTYMHRPHIVLLSSQKLYVSVGVHPDSRRPRLFFTKQLM